MARPTYPTLLSALTLGTARRELSGEVGEWLDEISATDPTADAAERLLAAFALTERSNRFENQLHLDISDGDIAENESGTPPCARLAKGLQLILEGTYPDLLEEGVAIVLERQSYIPAPLLPLLHPRAAALMEHEPERALRYLKAAGNRGKWLARQKPEWAMLSADYDHATALKATGQPGQRAAVLGHWRRNNPPAARKALEAIWNTQKPRSQEILLEGMKSGLSADDHFWLRAALEPKRKGVRRKLTRLLLQSGETRATDDFALIAKEILRENGRFTNVIESRTAKDLLQVYGGTKAPQRPERLLLEIMSPTTWANLVDTPITAFWSSLQPLELSSLARAFAAYDEPVQLLAFCEFLLGESAAKMEPELVGQLGRRLSENDFNLPFDRLLTRQADTLRAHGLPRTMALRRLTPWTDRLSSAVVTRLIDDLRAQHLDYTMQRTLAYDWKRATTLIDPEIFNWLRQQLHATTERYDAFGKLATEMLQTTAFRRELRKS